MSLFVTLWNKRNTPDMVIFKDIPLDEVLNMQNKYDFFMKVNEHIVPINCMAAIDEIAGPCLRVAPRGMFPHDISSIELKSYIKAEKYFENGTNYIRLTSSEGDFNELTY